jgi:hypothetical protein
MTKSQIPAKPGDAQIRVLADKRIKEVLKTHGASLPEDVVLEGFRDWVLPDRHLAIIRERLERWREVASKKAARHARE